MDFYFLTKLGYTSTHFSDLCAYHTYLYIHLQCQLFICYIWLCSTFS